MPKVTLKKQKKYVKAPIDDFAAWQKEVKKSKLSVFDKIYNHYKTLHKKETAYKYAVETMAKVLSAAEISAKQEKMTFEYEAHKIEIPSFMLDLWIKKAKKEGLISLELHENIEKFINKYTDLNDKMASQSFDKLLFQIDTLIAKKAGLEVNPASPVTFRSRLIFKEDKVVFFSEKYGSQEMPYTLYYKWLNSILSEGNINAKTHSQMAKYAEKGIAEEPSHANIEFYAGFIKFVGKQVKGGDHVKKKIKEEYPSYFVSEMEKLMMNEVDKLSELNIKPPEKKAGSIEKIHEKGRIMLKLMGWDSLVGIDPGLYHTIYSETMENKGKSPEWARYKLYKFLYNEGHGYPSDDAMTVAKLLVSFFEYKVAADAQSAKNIMEKGKKLKGVPKK